MDIILLQGEKKVSSEAETHENIEYEIIENDLYQIDNMSLDEKKESTELRKRALESKRKNIIYLNVIYYMIY